MAIVQAVVEVAVTEKDRAEAQSHSPQTNLALPPARRACDTTESLFKTA